ncbi:hypothetical protein NBO_967g0001 [Nosema bombycis CQ1]|uniref:Uncharacterized protein n=1 Tax=Nosema bombycis (strain CQ1 / CVCC 102059) TaxID=578461 RepID=R0KLY4_NOSB1|nr:hypothetical protein NBO_967g0001 [Nosema bombycis CQ1]|eukprot:EOB11656.1 hypothetical protein NBO_967g0001 [Nosema bombycis CQ1]
MGAPLSEDYEALRTIVKGKNYELIYSALLNEVINIKKVGVDVKDIEGLENYVQNEVRELIFSSKGLPTYLIRLSIFIGPVFEKDLSLKVSTYLITYYSSDFQLFISKNFKTLKSISLLYKELETIVKNFENKFFNLPTEWQILPRSYEIIVFNC